MNVLVGIDGSAASLEAVRQVGQLLSAADCVALYYSPPELRLKSARETPPEVVAKARKALAATVFEEAREALPQPLRGNVKAIVGTRDPRQGLLAAADEVQAQLIAVGARGASGVKSLLMGSVSRSIVRTSRVPVLVARPRPTAPRDEYRVLWTYDGSESTEQLLRTAELLSWPSQTKSHLLTVVGGFFPPEVPTWMDRSDADPEMREWAHDWFQQHESEKKQMGKELETLCATLPAKFRNGECHVAEGHPAEQILKSIQTLDADLVVLGTRGLGVVSSFLLGSTSEAVLAHAPCSVLLVRHKEQP